jgi:hypothetical protein
MGGAVKDRKDGSNEPTVDSRLGDLVIDSIVVADKSSVTATAGNPGRSGETHAATVSAAEVQPLTVEWLWPKRVAAGALTVLGGHPGLGKSLLTIRLIADLTQGTLTGTPERALLLSAEDAREQVVVPRLIAAGADTARVYFDNELQDGLRRQLLLPTDVPLLTEMVEQHKARLLVIDPLAAHLEGKVDSWKDQSIRLALRPLVSLAESTGAAVLVVSHLNKGRSTDPVQRLGGSIGLAAAARSVLLLDRDPDDPDGETGSHRVLAQVKSNLGLIDSSLRFRVETTTLGNMGAEPEVARIVELGTSHYTGSELLAARDAEPVGARADAIRFIREELKHGPRTAKELERRANEAGLSWDTVKQSKAAAGVKSKKLSGVKNGPWMWELVEPTHSEELAAA